MTEDEYQSEMAKDDAKPVQNHPLELQQMADLSDGDNYAKQLAKAIKSLATNIVIPEDAWAETGTNYDELPDDPSSMSTSQKKQAMRIWAANNTNGDDRIYADIGGDVQVAKPTASAPAPSEVRKGEATLSKSHFTVDSAGGSGGPMLSDVAPPSPSEGDEWVVTRDVFASPPKKAYIGGKWVTLSTPTFSKTTFSNPDDSRLNSDGEYVIDVSDISEEKKFKLWGSKGHDSQEYHYRWQYNNYYLHDWNNYKQFTSDSTETNTGADGGFLEVRVDLTPFNEIKLALPNETGGSRRIETDSTKAKGERQDVYEYSSGTHYENDALVVDSNWDEGPTSWAGGGGDSAAIYADGSLLIAAGGGKGAGYSSTQTREHGTRDLGRYKSKITDGDGRDGGGPGAGDYDTSHGQHWYDGSKSEWINIISHGTKSIEKPKAVLFAEIN